jgi:hypothetical protein
MASIKISDLRPAGSDLFSDSESYISELGDSELNIINGGFTSSPVCVVWSIRITVAASIAASIVVTTAQDAH